MMPRLHRRSFWLFAPHVLLAALGTLAGCTSDAPLPASESNISCIADRQAATVYCEPARLVDRAAPTVDRSGTAIVLRSLGLDVAFEISDVVWDSASVAFVVRVKNLTGQPLGTTAGSLPDSRGIRLHFVSSVLTSTSGQTQTRAIAVPAVGSVTGTDSVTAVDEPYLAIPGVVDSAAWSAPTRLRLIVPATAQTSLFSIVLVAPVAYPHGWLRVRTDGPSIEVGERAELRVVQMDALGRALESAPHVQWATSTPQVATVSADGEITGRTNGMAEVAVSCALPCQSAGESIQLAVAPSGGVTLSVRPAARFPISRFVYGVNFMTDDSAASTGKWPWFGAIVPRGVTLNRIGGNRMSAYNWRNNYSHAGLDYNFQNDQLLDPSTIPGEAIRRRVAASRARTAATLVTIPMLPFVAADAQAQPLDTLGATRAKRMREHFVPNRPSPAAGDTPGTVYQNQFVQWLDATFPIAAADSLHPIFFSLDNEPDIWYSTHHAIMSDTLGRFRKETYDGFSQTSIAYARAVKSARADALVFGPATATFAGVMTLGQFPDADPVHGKKPFFDVYLDAMREAERTHGRRLLDVLDMHFYTEVSTRGGLISNDYAPQNADAIAKRLQAPRSLWDPTFDEKTWVSGVTDGPVALLPRLRGMIAAHYPGTKIAITEYYYGRSGDISGGLAQTDVLGIFGREGVFAATLWPQANVWAWKGVGNDAYAYAFGAFRLFRDYDGAGSAFGDVGLAATTSNRVTSSIYASQLADGRRVLVVINKTAATLCASIPMTTGPQPRVAHVYTMRDGAPIPVRGADITVAAGGYLTFDMPAMSASTLVLEY